MESGGDPALLAALIAEDCLFHSSVVHTPQSGKPVVMAYLVAAAQVLGNEDFRYVRELVDGDEVMLEFVTELDGIAINGVDRRAAPGFKSAESKVVQIGQDRQHLLRAHTGRRQRLMAVAEDRIVEDNRVLAHGSG